MTKNKVPDNFLGLPEEWSNYEEAKVVILEVPYEGTVSFGKGTAKGPSAIIKSSKYLEMYDEVLQKEIFDAKINTQKIEKLDKDPKKAVSKIYSKTKELVNNGKFVVMLGGEHSISYGYFKALKEKYLNLGVIQFDAHADLREEYEGSKYSHACVMARIREQIGDQKKVCQIGIRSMSTEEAETAKDKKYDIHYAHKVAKSMQKNDLKWLEESLKKMPKDIFITLDVDFFSWDVINSTGTPEPGGISWYPALEILEKIFNEKNVVGFDIVELCEERNGAFAMAKLIYRMIGLKF